MTWLLIVVLQTRRIWLSRQQHKILKAWGGKYGMWFGLGFQSERTRVLERSWLKTVLPPYLRGTGISLSLGLLSIRIGGYRRLSDHGMFDEEVDTAGELAALGWTNGGEVLDGVLQGVEEEAPRSEDGVPPEQPDTSACCEDDHDGVGAVGGGDVDEHELLGVAVPHPVES